MMATDVAARTLRASFAEDVAAFLRRTPRELPSKYFYDPLGSALFDAICQLPWYRITRAESALLARHAPEFVDGLRRPITLGELGCGNGDKLALFAARVGERFESIQLIDISAAALDTARRKMEALRVGPVALHAATYEHGIDALRRCERDGALLVLFLGSNIGNFEPEDGRALLSRIRQALRPGDALLLGTDLVKPERDLLLAYDDPLQVTAAFNRNLLRRINDELGGTFDLDAWTHRAVWNGSSSRMEMHLVSARRQRVAITAIGLELTFEGGEAIWTESSYKFDPAAVTAMGRAAGYSAGRQWVDEAARFAVTRFTV